ncbi:hypothetical protein LPN01_16245 [Sphingomonas sp. A2-49]|uniref:hypothetical protein n=1 Tax=Sphingomonas sp. A2-49 TaxID=1391375 RepID=UPI0021CFAC1F|nr:hypothetical protein [Sphingomonas sp. A2-49]MCU6455631.1 hypothetical protein [Sphingomonas sp. A2-49]
MTVSRLRLSPLLPVLMLVAGCGSPAPSQQDLDGLDRELADATGGNRRDPALTAALADQIMVDPALAQSANATVVRPPSRPDPLAMPPEPVAPRPDRVTAADLTPTPAARGACRACRNADGALTLGELAAREAAATAGCARDVSYSAGWANRLPAALPLYPDARVREAAGNDACGLRVVSFASAAPVGRILDWYTARARRAGYSVEHQASGGQHVLGGTRGESAYVAYVTAAPSGGSAIDLVVR